MNEERTTKNEKLERETWNSERRRFSVGDRVPRLVLRLVLCSVPRFPFNVFVLRPSFFVLRSPVAA